MIKALFLCLGITLSGLAADAQYVQPERNDTTYLMPKSQFDAVGTKQMITQGKATIKGVAYTKPPAMQRRIGGKNKILAGHVKITLFPITPYFEEYLKLKKDQNPKKLKFAFLSPEAFKCRLESISNSAGEFTFFNLKPGKYYVETVVNWSQTKYYDQYVGSGSSNYGTTDYYKQQAYNDQHSDYLKKEVEVTTDGEVVEIKLN